MSRHISAANLVEFAQIVDHPRPHTVVDRTFGLPTELYALTVAAYLAFLGIMAAAFGNPELAIPMVIFVVFIGMAFGVSAMWTQIGPDDGARRMRWSEFSCKGIMTHGGHVSARSATAQVLILPVAVLLWGIAIAVIVAAQ